MKKTKYFPNNWDAFHSMEDDFFDEIPFDVFMDWKIGGYEIPSSIAAIVRAKNIKTGKVKEYVYQRTHAAKDKCRKLMDTGNMEITVAEQNTIHFLYPKDKDDIF